MRRFLVAFSALCLGLLLAELVVRASDPPPRPLAALSGPMYRLSENPVLRYEYVPDFVAAEDAPPASAGFVLNSAGFRDVERRREKPAGVYRILVLGDSITAGNGIERREDVFVARLERLLNEGAEGPPRYQVLNMGVGGYHTLQEVELLRARGLAYDPDEVLVAFCVNDFDFASDGGVCRTLRAQNADLDVEQWRGGMRSRLAPLLRVSRLAFLAYHRLGAAAPRGDEDLAYVEDVLEHRTPVEAGIELLAELQAEHGFEATLVLVPALDGPFDEYAYGDLHALAAAKGSEHGVRVVDLLPDLRASGLDPAAIRDDHVHPNERGHLALARILQRHLLGPD